MIIVIIILFWEFNLYMIFKCRPISFFICIQALMTQVLIKHQKNKALFTRHAGSE